MSQTIQTGTTSKAWVAGGLAWLLPGAGHVWLGLSARGVLLGAIVWGMFITGLSLGGHLYNILDTSNGLLSVVFGLCDLGTGLLYFASRALGIAVEEQGRRATSEYGNVFLMISGLLNYLLALDAYDIGAGRKR